MGLVLLRLLLSCKTSWRTPSGVGARSKKGFAKQLSTHYTSGFARCDAALPTITIISRPFRDVIVIVGQYEDRRLPGDGCLCQRGGPTQEGQGKCLQGGGPTPSVRENGETYIAFCERMESHYQGEKTKAVAAEAKCTAATLDYDSKVTSCSALKSTWTSQKGTCDEQQDVMDAAFCEVFWRPQRRFARSMLRAMSRPLHPTIWM